MNSEEREVFWRYESFRVNPKWSCIFTHETSTSSEVADLRIEAAKRVYDKTMNDITKEESDKADLWIQDKLIEYWRPAIGEYGGEIVELPYLLNLVGDLVNLKGYTMKTFISVDGKGYERVSLAVHDGKYKKFYINRLMGLTFIKNPEPEVRKEIDHLNCNHLCNWVRNLEWVTHAENMRRAVEKHRRDNCMNEESNFAVYTNKQMLKVCEMLMNTRNPFWYISSVTGVKVRTIMRVYLKKQWIHLSEPFDFPKRDNVYSKYNLGK